MVTLFLFEEGAQGRAKTNGRDAKMTNSLKHRVVLFALKNGAHVWDHNDQAVVERIVEVDDLAEAQRITRDAILASGSFSAASLSPAVGLFAEDDLAGYLQAVNFEARLLEEHPQKGTWISLLTEDLDHWAEIGVKTPRDLDAYLDGCFQREMEKKAMEG